MSPLKVLILTTAQVGQVITTNDLTVKSIRVVGTVTTAAGHAYRIDDPSNNLRWRTVATGAYYVEESITQRQWDGGIKLAALDSGEIHIEYELHGSSVY